jgi:predicted nuclease with TOPRIM domain
MNDNKKIVRFDENNKLIIENDNAVITGEGATSRISGKYEMDGKDVKKLFAIVNDKVLLQVDYSGIIRNRYNTSVFTTDKEVHTLLKDLSDSNAQLNEEIDKLRETLLTMRSNFDNLLTKVKIHNETRLFNKIKLD